MKQMLTKLVVLMISAGLVGCSSNTQSQNTGIGAVTGAVVGGLAGSTIGGGAGRVAAVAGGAIVGALIGGWIGQSMDSSDNTKAYQALNHNPTNSSSRWKNKNTGATYSVTPTSGRITMNGNPNCRKYRTTAIINGKKQKVYGVACLQSDGSWKTVS